MDKIRILLMAVVAMTSMTVLAEDEKSIVDIIRFNLNREGYETLEAYDGETGLTLARRE